MATTFPVTPLMSQQRSSRFLIYQTKNLLSYSTSNSLHPPLPLRFRPCLRLRSPSLSSMTTPQASDDSSQSDASPAKTVRVVVKGRVQGVFYRNWTVENASRLGLKGWVRNRRDGSVEVLLSGSPDAVQEMEQRCRRGPPDAVVTGLEVYPSSDNPGSWFELKPTV